MDRFEETVPMSTYLVAFMISEFEYKEAEKKNSNVTFRIWARKEAIDQVNLAKEIGPKILSYFAKYFDVDYPLPKQDMAAIPDFNAGAMENWGLITFRYNFCRRYKNIYILHNVNNFINIFEYEYINFFIL